MLKTTLNKMEGLNIYINKMRSSQQSGLLRGLVMLLIIIFGLLLLPLLILFVFFGAIYNFLRPSKRNYNNIPSTFLVQNSADLEIEYKWLKPDDVPEKLLSIYEERGIMIFKTNPYLIFFDGYFTDFKVERDDGIFLQKVILDTSKQEIISAPLFFFRYEDLKIEEIVDLYGYEFESKGNPDDFLICVYGKDQNFEVRLTK